MSRAGSRRPRTSRLDTLWSTAAAVLSVLLVGFAVGVLLLSQRELHSARAHFRADVMQVARAQHRSPRDPAVLRVVQRRLPPGVQLIPSSDVLTSGRVEMLSRRLRASPRRYCLLLPASADGHVASCR